MIKSMNVACWVQRWSELEPHKTAIIFEEARISYLDLHRRANRTACWLQSLGFEKGDRLTAMLANCPDFIDLYLACALLGVIFVPLNHRASASELDYLLKNSSPRLFVFGSETLSNLEALNLNRRRAPVLFASVGPNVGSGVILDFRSATEAFDGQSPLLPDSLPPAAPEEAQVIMYTSGTTGQPKGAVLSYRKTFFNCLNADIFFKMQFDDVMLVIMPLFHSGGLFIQTSPSLYKGATLVIHPRFDPTKFYEDVERYRVTKFLGVPTIYKALLKAEPQKRWDLSSLKVCAGGGEKTPPDLIARCRKAGLAFRQMMGQTETSILLWASEEDSFRKPGTVGRPVFHAEVDIVDSSGRPVRPGEVGEIVARGSIMMKEYWQDPLKTEETIRNGWLHTGDLARMDEEGYYYLVDRASDMYISGGENVYPAEVERIIREHPEIEDIAIVGIPDQTWGEVGHAHIIRKPGSAVTAEEIIAFCKERLARYKCPKHVTFAKRFPRTSLGKVRKQLLSAELDQ